MLPKSFAWPKPRDMRLIYFIHIVAGSLGLLSGYVALYSVKGLTLHRRSGTVFVYSMITMAVAGTTISLIRNVDPRLNIPSAVLAAYLVITSLTTVRPLPDRMRWASVALMFVGFAAGFADVNVAFKTLMGSSMRFAGIPLLFFASAGIMGGIGDLRILRHGPLRGASRITRHLWRMSFALLIAALSFFLGQAKVIPKPIRIVPLLMLPILAVLVTMLYWVWRIRIRQSVKGLVINRAPVRLTPQALTKL